MSMMRAASHNSHAGKDLRNMPFVSCLQATTEAKTTTARSANAAFHGTGPRIKASVSQEDFNLD
jgi:hypothetical protein